MARRKELSKLSDRVVNRRRTRPPPSITMSDIVGAVGRRAALPRRHGVDKRDANNAILREHGVATASVQHHDLATVRCPACAHHNAPTDQFCTTCAAPLALHGKDSSRTSGGLRCVREFLRKRKRFGALGQEIRRYCPRQVRAANVAGLSGRVAWQALSLHNPALGRIIASCLPVGFRYQGGMSHNRRTQIFHTMEHMDLKNAVVLITGGSSGIGRAAAQVFAQAGARVAITGRDAERLAEAARSLGVVGIQADVANEADIMRTFREVKEKLGDLDVLINNAGIGVLKELIDQDRGSFDAVFATNVTGVMLMSREAARLFKERKRGNIVNISSTASLRGAPKGTAYYASKFALRGMTECWRAELRKYNVRVFLINPSEVITDFARRAGFPQVDNPTKLRSEDIAHMMKAVLEMSDRGFTPELSVFATNPVD